MGLGGKMTSGKKSGEKMAAKTASGGGATPPEPATQLFSVAPDMSPARPLF